MVSFSNVGPYFEAIGVPSFVIPLIKGMSQVVTFEAPDEPDGEWIMGTETGKGHYLSYNRPCVWLCNPSGHYNRPETGSLVPVCFFCFVS